MEFLDLSEHIKPVKVNLYVYTTSQILASCKCNVSTMNVHRLLVAGGVFKDTNRKYYYKVNEDYKKFVKAYGTGIRWTEDGKEWLIGTLKETFKDVEPSVFKDNKKE